MSKNGNESNGKRRTALIIGVLIALIGVGAAGIFAYRNVTQASQASAEAMPPNTLLYGSLDVVGLLDPTALRRFDDVFDSDPDDGDVVAGSPEAVFENLNTVLDDYGVEFQSDIQSWVGRSIGVGVLAVEATIDGPLPTEYVIATEIRDEGEADAFLERFSAENTTSEANYNRVDYLIENELSGGQLVLGRSDSLMLWASSTSAMEQAIDAQQSESLADAEEYNAVLAKLPEQRALTLVIMQAGYNALRQVAVEDSEFGLALGGVPLQAEQFADLLDSLGFGSLKTAAMAFNIASTGFEIDLASVINQAEMTEAQLAAARNIDKFEGSVATILPESTVLFIGAPGLGHSWERITTLVTSGVNAEDFEDSLTLADQTLGFSVEGDLMPQLTGDMALALFADSASSLAPLVGADVGLLMVNGVADSAEMADISSKFALSLSQQGFQALDSEGITTVNLGGIPVASFGVQGDQFALSSNGSTITSLGSDSALANDTLYSDASGLLPETMKLTLFADTIGTIMTLNLPEQQLAQALLFGERIPAAVMGMQTDETGGIAKLILMTRGN